MTDWIRFDAQRTDVPSSLSQLVAAIRDALPKMTAQEGVTGGLHRNRLIATLAPAVDAFNLVRPNASSFADKEVDLVARSLRVGVSVQAGRAHNNNGVLLATLAAAALPDVDWLVVAAPERYKGTAAAEPCRDQLQSLSTSRGVSLDLAGVLVLAY